MAGKVNRAALDAFHARQQARLESVRRGQYDFERDLVRVIRADSWEAQLLRLTGTAPHKHVLIRDGWDYYIYRYHTGAIVALFRHLHFKFGERPRGSMHSRIYTIPTTGRVRQLRKLRKLAADTRAVLDTRQKALTYDPSPAT